MVSKKKHISAREIKQALVFVLGADLPRSFTYRFKQLPPRPNKWQSRQPGPERYFDMYDASDHAYLIYLKSEAANWGFVEVTPKKPVIDGLKEFIQFTVKLTPLGRRALRLVAYEGIWNTSTEAMDAKQTMEHHRARFAGSSFKKSWADMILATDVKSLRPLRDELMLEMMKRKTHTSDDDVYFVKA